MDSAKKVFHDEIQIKELSSPPSTPPSGYGTLYTKTDKKMYYKDSDGVETEAGLSGYSGSSGTSGYSGGTGVSGYSGYSGKSGYSGYSGATGGAGSLGAWASKSSDSTYQAATDGFVVGYTTFTVNTCYVAFYTDSGSNPTTMTQYVYNPYAWNPPGQYSICCPVKKNDYWKTVTSNCSLTLYWIPLGS